MITIRPQQMAQIYNNRSGRFAFQEVMHIIRYFEKSESTVAYWKEVLTHLKGNN